MTGYSGQNVYVIDPGNKNINSYLLSAISEGLVYALKSGLSLPRSSANAAILQDSFTKSSLDYKSCYQYTKSY